MSEAKGRERVWTLIRAALGIAGIGLVIWLVRDQGVDAMREVLVPALAWL
ncbi:MAG: hypothetical protein H6719_34620, partial [Sandaracinaceae bacterium]|nr:hypothetical protein [Sandaracinaceae bacterium]